METALSTLAVTAILLLVARLATDSFSQRKGIYHSAAKRARIVEETRSTQNARHRITLGLNAVTDKNELLDNLELALRLRKQVSLSPAPTMSEAETAERVARIEDQIAEAEREIRNATS